MSILFNESPRILPETRTERSASILNPVSPIVKLEIIREGEGSRARNAHKLDLTDSIYEKIED